MGKFFFKYRGQIPVFVLVLAFPTIYFSNHIQNLDIDFNVNILSNLSVKKFPLLAKKVEITFLKNKDHFTEKEWKALYKLSENTFVEETESLKKGAAGAGLTDND